MDKVFQVIAYCFLTFPLIWSQLQIAEFNPNDLQWNFDDLKDIDLVFNTNKSSLRRHPIEKSYVKNIQIITECCQTIEEFIQPKGGVSKNGRILELYRDVNSTQNFYQISCKERGKRCGRLPMFKTWSSRHQCVQKYSFTYALVREFNAPESFPWRLDYIRIRNGCSCERIK